jgi:hypothetical protein
VEGGDHLANEGADPEIAIRGRDASPCSEAQNPAARSRGPHLPANEQRRTALGVRGVLHSPDALHDRLESRREHGGGQFGYALAIADSGFDAFLDQPPL